MIETPFQLALYFRQFHYCKSGLFQQKYYCFYTILLFVILISYR